MPSVAQSDSSSTAPSSKKRRRDDNHQSTLYANLMVELAFLPTNDSNVSSPSAGNIPRGIFADKTALDNGGLFEHFHSVPSAIRKIIPLPPGKRQRTTVDIDVEGEGEPMQRSPASSPPQKHHLQREHNLARHASREELDEQIRGPAVPTSTFLMSRCHICSRKPNKKSDLDSFADCQGCGQRTCYVCIRECLGWGPNIPPIASTLEIIGPNPPTRAHATTSLSEEGGTSFTMLDADAAEDMPYNHLPPTEAKTTGAGAERHERGWTSGGGHREVVCSRCCVEKGADGDVVCLGCLPFVEG
ncbi:hypothetical protein N657DRAFT_676464 [Parathielavia appendiculata]|uniref:Uncharacterized protein n=1 Tax=Parathielavia appendiculata TaxID=2587402 RepID=A0AAN6UBW3_9PEZI|nr:hypothetical protein N657DRAFT_676464 [Parathielavia appendiculata]